MFKLIDTMFAMEKFFVLHFPFLIQADGPTLKVVIFQSVFYLDFL